MIRFFIFFAVLIFFTNCGSFPYQKTIRLSDGRKALVFYDFEKTDSGSKVFVAEYTNETGVRKESIVEDDVIAIWAVLKTEAERENIDEAVIKYGFTSVDLNERKIFEGIIFVADREESGRWSIKKVE